MAGTSPRVVEGAADPGAEVGEAELARGARVGEYEIRQVIDTGGMATVYAAVHPLIGKDAAIKVLSAAYSADTDVVSRFVQEARAVNRIRHRNIVDIFSLGQLPDGRRYCVMELLDGESLDRRLRAQPGPTYEELFSVMGQTADALEAAHQAGVVHRDVKPENVFLVRGAGGPVVKLLDFGVAKVLGPGERLGHQTGGGVLVGTPHYMAPEQCAAREVDARTDVYALGVVMYQVFTGRLPFDSEHPFEIVCSHIGEAPPAPVEIAAFAPALADLVMACLAKDPAARPQRAADVRDRLRAIERDGAAPPPSVQPPPRLSQRGQRRALMGGLALSGMVLTLARFSVGNPVVAAAPGRAATIEDLTYDPASPPREPEDPSVLKGTHGTAAFTLGLRPTAPGPYTFEVWVLDAGRNLSNVLTGQIDVSEPSPTEP